VSRTDLERLRLFCASVDEALGRRAVREATVSDRWRFQYTQEEGLSFETDRGDEEDLRSLLVAVRRFFAPKEDVYFTRVLNIVEQVVRDPELVAANRTYRQAWSRLLRGGLHFHVDGVNYAPEDAFDIVVNGKLFHNDVEKAALFDRLDPMFQQWLLTNVNSLVIQSLGILHAEREVIEEAFARSAVRSPTGASAPGS
jgi:hypothetical protein